MDIGVIIEGILKHEIGIISKYFDNHTYKIISDYILKNEKLLINKGRININSKSVQLVYNKIKYDNTFFERYIKTLKKHRRK